MPPSIGWVAGFIATSVLFMIILVTIGFFVRRIRNYGRWQDIYLTVTYVLLAISTLVSFANLTIIPLFGNTLETQEFLKTLWRIYFFAFIGYLLPLTAFTKMTFRPNSRIASVLTQIIMFLSGITIAVLMLSLSYTLVWSDETWTMVYQYHNRQTMYLSMGPFLLSTLWFAYEGINLFIREKRKESPNPTNVRRFLFLGLSGGSLVLSIGVSFVLQALGEIYPFGVIPILDVIRYVSPVFMSGIFVFFSSTGWIMPGYAKKGIKKESGGN